jgi:prepilin-type N-terminal cleavage/methylation domain-containing protein
MMKFNREEGLTLIELLITIAVIAIVAAISVPVITNVVNSSNLSALEQTNNDVAKFVEKYNNSGVWEYDAATQTFTGFIDLDGNNVLDTDAEKIEELKIDVKKFKTTAGSVDATYGDTNERIIFTLVQ